jgi:malate dehydrogenase (oxaloacetate-decarboxylating)
LPLEEPVQKIMIENVFTVRADALIIDATRLMIERNISCLLVSVGSGAIGIITEKDILGKVIAVGRDPKKVRVRDIMSTPLIVATASTSIGEAASKMMTNNIRRLVVMSEDGGRLVGLVTMKDIIRWVAARRRVTDLKEFV